MKQVLPWKVTGIPAEAREMARSMAARDGMSVGDWLTRRIYVESRQDAQEPGVEPGSTNDRNARNDEALRGRDEIMRQLARMEGATESAFRRIDATLQSLGRRMETPERSQDEAMLSAHRAALGINDASREQARKFSQLARRVEHIEHAADPTPLRNAVRGLHHCVSRLAEQTAKSENISSARFEALTRNIESVTKAGQAARVESDQLAKDLGERLNALTEKIARSEERLGGMENDVQNALGRHTSSFERKFEDISERLERAERIQGEQESAIEEAFKPIKERLGAIERRNQEAYSEFRLSLEELRRRLDSVDLQPDLQRKYRAPAIDDESRSSLPGMHGEFAFREETPQATNAAQEFLAAARRSTNPAAEARGPSSRLGLAGARPNRTGDSRERNDVELRRSLPVITVGLLFAIGAGYLILDSGLSPFRDSFGSVQGGMAPTAAYATEPNASALPPVTSPFSAPGGGLAPDGRATMPAIPPEHSKTLLHHANEEQNYPPKFEQYASLNPPPPIAATTRSPAPEAPAAKSSSAPRARSASTDGHAAKGHAATDPAPSPSRSAGEKNASPIGSLLLEARGGSAAAALLVGLQYLEEDGVPSAESEGVRWLRTAAEQGQPMAQYRLGSIYEQGRGIPADPSQATVWYERAARSGNRNAMHNIAVAYANGIGIEKNLAEALSWFGSAADLGLTDSQFNLAVLYERGMGVPVSLNEAYKWYFIAALQGDTEAQTRAGVLAARLPEDQRLAAERAATTYAPQPLDQAANELPTLTQIH
jgi:localization factor PodJL